MMFSTIGERMKEIEKNEGGYSHNEVLITIALLVLIIGGILFIVGR